MSLQPIPPPLAQHPDGGVVCPECGNQLLTTDETMPTWECTSCDARFRLREPIIPEYRLDFIRAIPVCCHHCERPFTREVTHAKQWVECPHCGLWAIAVVNKVWTPEGFEAPP
jgi:DNA-directed RNA polymerase subunit RPC12/RpoP